MWAFSRRGSRKELDERSLVSLPLGRRQLRRNWGLFTLACRRRQAWRRNLSWSLPFGDGRIGRRMGETDEEPDAGGTIGTPAARPEERTRSAPQEQWRIWSDPTVIRARFFWRGQVARSALSFAASARRSKSIRGDRDDHRNRAGLPRGQGSSLAGSFASTVPSVVMISAMSLMFRQRTFHPLYNVGRSKSQCVRFCFSFFDLPPIPPH